MVTTRRKSGDSSGSPSAGAVVNSPPHDNVAGEKDATDASDSSKGVKRRSGEGGDDQHGKENGEREELNDQQETNGTGAEADEPKPKRQATGGRHAGEIVEEGRITFFYRPKVGVSAAQSVDDVQRFYMLMSPTTGKGASHRLVVLGKKRMPQVEEHERLFGFVSAVNPELEAIMSGLKASSYETKTRGTRHVEAARAAGEGVYQIVAQGTKSGTGRSYTKLSFQLEIPQKPGEVQQELGIAQMAVYSLSIKNPKPANPPNAGLKNKADFKEEPGKQKEFGSYSWIGAEDTSLLDYERCELLLFGTTSDLKSELGEAAEQLVSTGEDDVAQWIERHHTEEEHTELIGKLREEILADEKGISTEPAATGAWA